MTRHQSSKVLDKYKEKLDQKAKQQGLNNVDELKEAYSDKIQELRVILHADISINTFETRRLQVL